MPLDPQAQAVLDSMPGGDLPDLDSVPVELMRQGFSEIGPEAPVEEVANVENRQIRGAAGEIGARTKVLREMHWRLPCKALCRNEDGISRNPSSLEPLRPPSTTFVGTAPP